MKKIDPTRLKATIITPLIGVIVICLQLIFNVEISDAIVEKLATALASLVSVGFVIYGILVNHDKEDNKEE